MRVRIYIKLAVVSTKAFCILSVSDIHASAKRCVEALIDVINIDLSDGESGIRILSRHISST